MITRENVIRNANLYLNIQGWTPLKDTEDNFKSAFTIGEDDPVTQTCRLREYNVTPYVYGRPSILSVTQLRTAVQSGTCPGGWDMQTGWGTGHFISIRRNLAGIDCSDYVMKSWGFSSKVINGVWYGTANLSRLCLEIRKDGLRNGDILLKSGHVRIFHCWADRGRNNAWIYEAAGARDETQTQRNALKRSFNPGDDQGCVGRWKKPWENIYTPYSPFPQFIDFTPGATCPPVVDNPRPTISVTCTGSGVIDVTTMCLDCSEINFAGERVAVRWRIASGTTTISGIRATYTPNIDLSLGRHRIDVIATNSVIGSSFRDRFCWVFDVV